MIFSSNLAAVILGNITVYKPLSRMIFHAGSSVAWCKYTILCSTSDIYYILVIGSDIDLLTVNDKYDDGFGVRYGGGKRKKPTTM